MCCCCCRLASHKSPFTDEIDPARLRLAARLAMSAADDDALPECEMLLVQLLRCSTAGAERKLTGWKLDVSRLVAAANEEGMQSAWMWTQLYALRALCKATGGHDMSPAAMEAALAGSQCLAALGATSAPLSVDDSAEVANAMVALLCQQSFPEHMQQQLLISLADHMQQAVNTLGPPCRGARPSRSAAAALLCLSMATGTAAESCRSGRGYLMQPGSDAWCQFSSAVADCLLKIMDWVAGTAPPVRVTASTEQDADCMLYLAAYNFAISAATEVKAAAATGINVLQLRPTAELINTTAAFCRQTHATCVHQQFNTTAGKAYPIIETFRWVAWAVEAAAQKVAADVKSRPSAIEASLMKAACNTVGALIGEVMPLMVSVIGKCYACLLLAWCSLSMSVNAEALANTCVCRNRRKGAFVALQDWQRKRQHFWSGRGCSTSPPKPTTCYRQCGGAGSLTACCISLLGPKAADFLHFGVHAGTGLLSTLQLATRQEQRLTLTAKQPMVEVCQALVRLFRACPAAAQQALQAGDAGCCWPTVAAEIRQVRPVCTGPPVCASCAAAAERTSILALAQTE